MLCPARSRACTCKLDAYYPYHLEPSIVLNHDVLDQQALVWETETLIEMIRKCEIGQEEYGRAS